MASFELHLSGGRELVNGDRAKELIAAITVENPTHICLSNKSFDNDAATVIANYIHTLENITTADISDIIAGRPTEEALSTLSIICSSLKKFNLVIVNVSDNALGPKGIEACRGVLTSSSLEKLYVCNNGLSAEATELLASTLMSSTTIDNEDGGGVVVVVPSSSIQQCPALKLLHFYNNMSGDGGAKALSTIIQQISLSLEDLRFSATRAMTDGCQAIAAALIEVPHLRSLDISDNNFSGRAGELLVDAIKNKSKLEHLNLRDASLDDVITASDSEYSLFNGLVEATTTGGSSFIFLDLSGNGITDSTSEHLARALSHFTSLVSLFLDDNEIGTEGVKKISLSIKKLSNLKTLSLCFCELTAAGAYIVAKTVSELPHFANLEINGNALSDIGVDAIKGVLHNAGKILGDLDDNEEDADDDLEDALALYEDDVDEIGEISRHDDDDVVDDLVVALESSAIE